jgi:hypothetical protein
MYLKRLKFSVPRRHKSEKHSYCSGSMNEKITQHIVKVSEIYLKYNIYAMASNRGYKSHELKRVYLNH